MSIKTRLEALEAASPKDIILYLADGSTIESDGLSALNFYSRCFDEIRQGRAAIERYLHIVGTNQSGRMHELLHIMAVGPVKRRSNDDHNPQS
jgi:hypothetical protein